MKRKESRRTKDRMKSYRKSQVGSEFSGKKPAWCFSCGNGCLEPKANCITKLFFKFESHSGDVQFGLCNLLQSLTLQQNFTDHVFCSERREHGSVKL